MSARAKSVTKLPVYRLGERRFDDAQLDRLAVRAFGMDSYQGERIPDGVRLSAATKQFEVNTERGAVWMADGARLWKPATKPMLLAPAEAEAAAGQFLQENALFPEAGGGLDPAVERVSTASTRHVTLDAVTGKRSSQRLDVHVNFLHEVTVPDPDGDSVVRAPILGGEGKTGITLGHRGEVIALNSQWRAADGIETESPAIAKQASDAQFRELTQRLPIAAFDSSLAYQACVLDGNAYLCPVRVYRASMKRGRRKAMPLRNIVLPATEFGPLVKAQPRQPRRSQRDAPSPWANGVPGDYQKRGFSLARGAGFEAGTSWIGASGGLGGSQKNAQGFVDQMAAEGWGIRFNWGDANAWESDWRRNDDDWVDAVDWVFYTGHAGLDGWMLSNPDDGSLDYHEVGASPESPGDLWGQMDLEWIIIAACGPLEDKALAAGGGDALQRWRGAFDGLHLLMGYGAVTFDNEEEGKKVAQYARSGSTLLNAWFRAAREVQPAENGYAAPYGPKIYVGAMWANKPGLTSPSGDHIWGRGSVAPDPILATSFSATWTPT